MRRGLAFVSTQENVFIICRVSYDEDGTKRDARMRSCLRRHGFAWVSIWGLNIGWGLTGFLVVRGRIVRR
ncbi:hypothetical protein [Hallella bergensis]|uniref:hypothetical protein n=1 Tax=Hallella bergensis TaxID=242750 RepID=UPI0012EA3AD5|nr:hypothetical protein [Hallella bergensis]